MNTLETPVSGKKTVVFITGAFVSHYGWNNWKTYFEDRGYHCLVPPWLFKEGSPEELRTKHPDFRKLTEVGLWGLIEYYRKIIVNLDEKPVLIGHSTGGLIVQLLLQKGIAVAGIAIHSVPPVGVMSFKWSFIKSLWGPLGLFRSLKKTYLMTFEQWQYAFTNGMYIEDQKKSYYENVVPESRRVLRDCLSSVAKIDFKKPHVPLLFIAGSTDHIMPASLNYSNFKKYKHSASVTEYKEFEGKNHFVLGLPSWEDEAEFSADWLERNVYKLIPKLDKLLV